MTKSELVAGSSGQTIEITHPDQQISQVLHLERLFVTEGMPVCRYVALGYTGQSGDAMTGKPHLHFGTVGANPDRFTPIHGVGASTYDAPFFIRPTGAPAGTPQTPTPVAHHSCDGPCKQSTKAYIVDDVLNRFRIWPAWPLDEFRFVDRYWSGMNGGGFGYGKRSYGTYWYTRIQTGEQTIKPAQWRPDLKVTDPDWSVYAFIPVYNQQQVYHDDNVAPSAKYTVTYYDQVGQSFQETFEIDQLANAGKWVRVGDTYPTYLPREPRPGPYEWPLVLEVSNEQWGSCINDNCKGQLVLADAALFMPSDCGP